MEKRELNPGQKTMVVGLGGTGKRVLVELKRRLLEAGYGDSTQQPDLQLMCLDFDPAEECSAVRNDGQGKVCLAADEVCWLDGNLIHNRLRNLRQEHNLAYYRDWYPDLAGTVIQMGAYRAGAAQWRPLGRIGYYEYAERIQVVLRRGLNRLLEVNPQRPHQEGTRGVAVYLVCSLAGGTGGGIFLDVAYFLRTMPVDIKQIGLFLLPGVYAEYDISGRLFANTYACLKELSTFINQGEAFEARYPNGHRVSVPRHGESPFDQVFLYDNILQKDELTNNAKTMASVMAETVFFDLSSAMVGEMHQSSATNASKESGGHEDSPLARQSVFSMVGSLTLLLPSAGDLRGLIGVHYLRQGLLAAMAQAQNALNTRQGLEGLLAGEQATHFGELDLYITKLLEETVGKCSLWDTTFISQSGQKLSAEILQNRLDPKLFMARLDDWLAQLAQPRPEGDFTVPPNRLPDVDLGGAGPLRNAVTKLGDDLGRRVEAILQQSQEESDSKAQDLYIYLQGKSRAMREATVGAQAELKRTIEAPDGPFNELKKDLSDLLAVKPPHEGQLDQLAAAHWARRFLTNVETLYKRFACQIRVHLLLAGAIEKVCADKLVSEHLLREALQALPRITRHVERVQATVVERLERGSGPGVWSLLDEGFLQRLGDKVAETLPHEGALLGYLLYLQTNLKSEELASGVTPGRMAQLAQDYAWSRADEFLRRTDSRLLEPYAYIDDKALAKAIASARHDYMVRDCLLNTSENRRAYVALPTYAGDGQREGGRVYDEIKGLVGNVLEASTIDVRAYPLPDQGEEAGQPGRLLVRHLSLNHPATNLRGIGDYYYAYARYGANRGLFHIDQKFLGLPEVIDEQLRLKYVTCGNPGCHEDITEEPRTAIICKHCHRPIRSRCGNEGCTDNDLHRVRADWDPKNPDKYCPTCHKLARTYWWRCTHHNLDLRTESNYCENCLSEFHQKTRLFEEVSRREDVKRHLDCPGCQHDCRPEPFRIEFLEVYDEVPDEHTAWAWEVYHEHTRHGNCPKCGAQLLPFCPHHQGDEHRHFVHRFEVQTDCSKKNLLPQGQVERRHGRFFCTSDQAHAQEVIKECSFCHLPLKKDATYCPRCKGQRLPMDLEVTQAPGSSREGVQPEDWLRQRFDRSGEHPDWVAGVADQVRNNIDDKRDDKGGGWLWFGLSQVDWEKMKRAYLTKQAGGKDDDQGCGSPANAGHNADELPPEAAAEFLRGREEETHEPS
ncbi:MAG: tubulin-like doman-containing protein [Pseudomonadota bacterium]